MAAAMYTLKKQNFLNRMPVGKLTLPDPSLFTAQKMSALGILNLLQQLTYKKREEYLGIKLLIIIPQAAWHNSLLGTSPTTPTPGTTSTCQGQGFCLKLAHLSLRQPSGTPCLKKQQHKTLYFSSLFQT